MPESPRPQRHDSPASGTTAGPAEFLHSTLGYQLIQRGGDVQFSIWTYMPHVAIVARPILAAAPVLPAPRHRDRPSPTGPRSGRCRLHGSGTNTMLFDGIAAMLHSGDVGNYHGYAAVQGRGTVALPPELRRKYRLDEPGAQLEIIEREDGVIELRPTLPVPVDEMWFWTGGHQVAEREAEDDLAAGRFRTFADAESFIADLESLAADTSQ